MRTKCSQRGKRAGGPEGEGTAAGLFTFFDNYRSLTCGISHSLGGPSCGKNQPVFYCFLVERGEKGTARGSNYAVGTGGSIARRLTSQGPVRGTDPASAGAPLHFCQSQRNHDILITSYVSIGEDESHIQRHFYERRDSTWKAERLLHGRSITLELS